MRNRDAEMPTMAVAAISAKPMLVIGPTPKRAIKEPVIKLGAYIARTCHWMPSVALVTE